MAKYTKKAGESLGVSPKLPKKLFPGTSSQTDSTFDFGFVMSEKDKEDDDFKKMKRLVYHYEYVGRQMVKTRRTDITKKFNLATGIIDQEDYIKSKSEYETEMKVLDGEDLDGAFDIKFYPIIPSIVNTLVEERFKHYVEFSTLAVNEEATNEIIEKKNEDLRQMLIAPLMAQFEADEKAQGIQPGTDQYNQQLELFKGSKKIQDYYTKEYRLEIEKWASHQMEIDKRRFKIKDLEKNLLRTKIATDLPFFHVNLLENDYKPEVLDPRYCFYLKSPYIDDVSEGVMFGWFEYESPLNLITRFGDKLTPENIEKLQSLHTHLKSLFTIDTKARYNKDTPGIDEAVQNHLAFKQMGFQNKKDNRYRGDEFKERLLEISNQYLQVPRKLGKLTMVSDGQIFSEIVDETYKISTQPVYEKGKEKTVDTLQYGEHIEWFYINELWRCVKINLSVNPNPDNSDDIWITLEKFPVQIPRKGYKYGSIIPVHGGPTTNKHNPILSIVDRCKPWQVLYNYMWNRIDQLLQGEIGRFFALNQNLIPQESMGDSWGSANILKFALAARDTKIAPLDNSQMAMGGSALAATSGYGQVVDLTVTQEVMEKAKLSEVFKNECFMSLGLSPQFLSDISPSETATGITQGINRSATQIKGLYDEHFSLMENSFTTMLEFARFLAVKNGYSQQTYVNDEGERIIFQIPSDLLLHQLGVFVSSNMDDTIILEKLRLLALQDNTLGADVMDKFNLITSKSSADIFSKLKDSLGKKERQQQSIEQQQAKQQQDILASQEKQLTEKLQHESAEKELDRQNELRLQEMKTIGASDFAKESGYDDLMKLRESQLKQQNFYQSLLNDTNTRNRETEQTYFDQNYKTRTQDEKTAIEREKLQVQREQIAARLKDSNNRLQIAKVNK